MQVINVNNLFFSNLFSNPDKYNIVIDEDKVVIYNPESIQCKTMSKSEFIDELLKYINFNNYEIF